MTEKKLKVKQLKTKTLKKKVLKTKELKKPRLRTRKGLKVISCQDCGEDMVVGSEAQGGRCRKCTQAMVSV